MVLPVAIIERDRDHIRCCRVRIVAWRQVRPVIQPKEYRRSFRLVVTIVLLDINYGSRATDGRDWNQHPIAYLDAPFGLLLFLFGLSSVSGHAAPIAGEIGSSMACVQRIALDVWAWQQNYFGVAFEGAPGREEGTTRGPDTALLERSAP